MRSKGNNIEDVYPLTPMQEGMLFHSLYEKNTPVYLVQLSFRLQMALEEALVKECLDRLMKRHDVLRTAFVYEGRERPLQVVLKSRPVGFFYRDIRALSLEAEKENYLGKFKAKDRRRYFDFMKDPLLRISMIRLEELEYEFTWTFHHILMDGWCLGILISEFFQIYESLLTQHSPPLPEVKPYKVYIRWLERQDKERAREYWKTYLDGYEGLAEPPWKNESGKANEGYRSEEFAIHIGREETTALNKLARENKVTVSTIFQVLWGILLGKYNRRRDVVFGAVVSGRPAEIEGVEGMVGLFINTVPVRVSYENGLQWMELLKRVQLEALESEGHHYYPLGDIHSDSGFKQDLLDHILAFENFPVGDRLMQMAKPGDRSGAANFKILSVDVFEQTNYDLNVTVIPEEQLRITFKYNANVYDEQNLRRLGAHLDHVLTQLTGNPGLVMGRISPLSAKEKEKILCEINQADTGFPRDRTVHRLFELHAGRLPAKIALVLAEEQLTYDELNRGANRLARFLRSRGVTRDTLVGLLLDRSLRVIIAILGVVKAGGAYLPMDLEYPEERVGYMMRDGGAGFLLLDGSLAAILDMATTIDMDDPEIQRLAGTNLTSLNDPADLLYVIYTSGSTGKPKGAMITHRNVVRLLFNDRNLFDFGPNDVWTMFHSYCFDFSVWEMYGALLYGGKLILVPRPVARDPGGFLRILRREGVTVLNQIPSAFYHLVAEEKKAGRRELRVRYVIFGGEALWPVRLRAWKNRYPETQLINMFGITETTVHVTFKEIGDGEIDTNISNIGRPLPTLATYVVDANLCLMPVGIPGELCVGGEGLGRGYLNRPELTQRGFVGNPYRRFGRLYRSGDLARLAGNGDMEYLGRIDHQLKIRGFRIEPGEIEARLLLHRHTKEVVVVAREDEHGEYLCAYFTAAVRLDAPELKTFLLGQLPDYMIPAFFIQVEKMPITPSGKIDRKALPEPAACDLDHGETYVAPRNEVEVKLAEIWKKVLGVDRVGARDSFFNTGGDSMKSIRVLSLINKEFGTSFSVADIYAHDTIETFAAQVNRGGGKTGEADVLAAKGELESLKERILAVLPSADEVEDIYPVSDMEMGILFYYLKDPRSAFFHEQFVYQVTYPDFQDDVFKKALHLMMARHANLRACYNMEDFEQPVKLVLKTPPLDYKYSDISSLNRGEQERVIKNIIDEDRRQLFDIKVAPLWKTMVFDLGEENICVLVIFHHAIMDGWSNASFMAESNEFYLQLKENPGFRPGKLAASYRDFVLEQRLEKRRAESIRYWKTELEGYRKLLLPGIEKTNDGPELTETYSFNLDAPFLKNLDRFASQHRTSIKNVCFTAFLVAMNMFNTSSDLVVGIAANPRPVCPDSDKVLGMFVNTIPFRITTPDHLDWLELIGQVDRKMAVLKNHDKISLFEILRIIGEKSEGKSPVFDTVFNYVDFHVFGLFQGNDQIKINEQLSIHSFQNSNNPFTLTVNTTFDRFLVNVNYSASTFGREMVRHVGDYYKNILFKMMEEPHSRIHEMESSYLGANLEKGSDLMKANSNVQDIQFQF